MVASTNFELKQNELLEQQKNTFQLKQLNFQLFHEKKGKQKIKNVEEIRRNCKRWDMGGSELGRAHMARFGW